METEKEIHLIATKLNDRLYAAFQRAMKDKRFKKVSPMLRIIVEDWLAANPKYIQDTSPVLWKKKISGRK